MALLNEQIRKEVRSVLADVANPVTFKVFTQAFECQYCKETRELVEEVAALSDKVSVEVYDFEKDKALADSLGIDKVPGVAVVGAKDYGIRMFGIPSGYEFGSLIESIKMVSEGESGLSAETKKMVAKLTKPITIQVFSHPHLTLLPASRVARIPVGTGERPHHRAHGGSRRVPASRQQVRGHGRAAHGDRRDDPHRGRLPGTDVHAGIR